MFFRFCHARSVILICILVASVADGLSVVLLMFLHILADGGAAGAATAAIAFGTYNVRLVFGGRIRFGLMYIPERDLECVEKVYKERTHDGMIPRHFRINSLLFFFTSSLQLFLYSLLCYIHNFHLFLITNSILCVSVT